MDNKKHYRSRTKSLSHSSKSTVSIERSKRKASNERRKSRRDHRDRERNRRSSSSKYSKDSYKERYKYKDRDKDKDKHRKSSRSRTRERSHRKDREREYSIDERMIFLFNPHPQINLSLADLQFILNEGFKAAKISSRSEIIKSMKLSEDGRYYSIEVSNPKEVEEISKLSGMKLHDVELKFSKIRIKQPNSTNLNNGNSNEVIEEEKKEIENIVYEEDSLKKILISNIPHYYLKDDFDYLFEAVSTVKSIELIEDHATKNAKKYCLVEFDNDRQATSMIKCKI